MIRLRTGVVRSVEAPRDGVLELRVSIGDVDEPAIAYPSLTGPVRAGDRVALNTTAVEYGLGSGGYHFVMAVEGQEDLDPPVAGHVMKLRYTPHQAKVLAVEEQDSRDHDALDAAATLAGTPVAWAPLHSMVGAVAAGAKAAGADRVVYVMTDGAALPAWFSTQAAELRRAGLLDAVITAGQALGGDHEAVNVFSAFLAATSVVAADVVVVADGPGKVGTATRWGASDVASAMSLNAAGILGGRAVAALRVNFADAAYRHYGVSPHSLTALKEVALVPVNVAVPALEGDEREAVWTALKEARLEERHQLVEVTGEPALALLRDRGLRAETMGRSADEERGFFLAAGAAGVLAGRMAAGSRRWRAEGGART